MRRHRVQLFVSCFFGGEIDRSAIRSEREIANRTVETGREEMVTIRVGPFKLRQSIQMVSLFAMQLEKCIERFPIRAKSGTAKITRTSCQLGWFAAARGDLEE